MKNLKLGCCTYTVAEDFNKAPYDTLYRLADIGYETVEIGDFTQLSTRELSAALKRAGLSMTCVHFGIGYQEIWTKHIMEFADALGAKYIGYPALRWGDTDNAENYKKEAEVMNRLGRLYKENGFKMIYHNHNFEFRVFDGKYGLDILRENTDPDLVTFELDTYWIARGGENPVSYINKFAGRTEVLHCKDKTADDFFAPVGEGTLDFKAIINAAVSSGVQTLLVEQDAHRKPAFECAALSYINLKSILRDINAT